MHCNANSAFLDSTRRDELLNRLEGLPLAIAQAGAFLKESQMKLEDYIDYYDREFERLVNDEPDEQLLHYHGSIWTTWVISFDEIRSKNDAGIAAANLLILWSCLDNKDLWYELFSEAILEEHKGTFPSWMMTHIASDRLNFSKVMKILRRYSMIEETSSLGSYSIHPVVHKWAYHYFHDEICKTTGLTAIRLVQKRLATNLSFIDIEPLYRLVPHVKSIFEKISPLRNNSRVRPEHKREIGIALELLALIYLSHRRFNTACTSLTLSDWEPWMELVNCIIFEQQDPLNGATRLRVRALKCLREIENFRELLHSGSRLSAMRSLDKFLLALTRAE